MTAASEAPGIAAVVATALNNAVQRGDHGVWQATCSLCGDTAGTKIYPRGGRPVVDRTCKCTLKAVRASVMARYAAHYGEELPELLLPNEAKAKAKTATNGADRPTASAGTTGNRIYTVDSFIGEYTPQRFAIAGFAVHGQVVTLTGRTGHGKTTTLLKMLGCKANGVPFAGRLAPKGHVLFIAAENPIGSQHSCITMIESWPDFDKSHFHIFNVEQPVGIESLHHDVLTYVRTRGIELTMVGVDSATALFPGYDSNSNDQQRAYGESFKPFGALPGQPATFIICHPTKNAGRTELLPGGGGHFVNLLDGNYTVWNDDGILEVGSTKRRMDTWLPFKLRLVPQQAKATKDYDGQLLSAPTVEPLTDTEQEREAVQTRNKRDAIIATLATATPLYFTSAHKIAVDAGLILSTVDRKHPALRAAQALIQRMVRDKIIDHTEDHYSLTRKGLAYAKKLTAG